MLERIAELEHDGNEWVPAIAPLGDDPQHCQTCAWAYKARENEFAYIIKRAACMHVDLLEVTAFNASRIQIMCVRCGQIFNE